MEVLDACANSCSTRRRVERMKRAPVRVTRRANDRARSPGPARGSSARDNLRGRCHRRARQNAVRAGAKNQKSLPFKDSNALARARSSGIDIGYRIRQENIDRATADWYRRYTSALPPVVGFDHGLRRRARRTSSTHRAATRRSIDAGRARERVRPPPRGERRRRRSFIRRLARHVPPTHRRVLYDTHACTVDYGSVSSPPWAPPDARPI